MGFRLVSIITYNKYHIRIQCTGVDLQLSGDSQAEYIILGFQTNKRDNTKFFNYILINNCSIFKFAK